MIKAQSHFINKCLILITLLLLVVLLFPKSGLAATESMSYIPKNPTIKDQQNIEFLYKNLKQNSNIFKVVSDEESEDLLKALKIPKTFSEYYYSPDKEAFRLRESMKLVRAATCKLSRLTGIRGIDATNQIIHAAENPEGSNTPITFESGDKESFFSFWKNAYETFCPDLW